MGLYVGSLFILFTIIFYLFYTLSYNYYLDERRHAMQMQAHQLSSKIIFAHMNGEKLDLNQLANRSSCQTAFYDKDMRWIAGVKMQKKDLNQSFEVNAKRIRIVDQSSFGHLGVKYIVLEDDRFGKDIANLKRESFLLLLSAFMVILLIGYFLAKLFIKPIQMRRRQLDDFIKESTHELNTPVSALLMSVDAKKSLLDKNDERIKISAKRISDIYKDLTYLFLRDIDIHQKESVDMVLLLKEQIESIRVLAEKKEIIFHTKYQTPLLFELDYESAVRLISNLLSNAVKYNRRGGHIEVTVQTREIKITDNGIGISQTAQKEIFKRFYRATKQSGGFGLGLHIVADICRKYGITLQVDSKEGEGTTFRLQFP